MKKVCKIYLFFLMVIVTSPIVSADSFNNRFKNWLLGPEANTPVAISKSVKLDAVSAECMQCHNGRDSRHVVVKSADSPMKFTASGQQSNHPVGMDYDRYVTSQPASFRPRAALNPRIGFINGQVGCISCHEQKSREERAYNGLTATNAVAVPKKEMCTSRKNLTVGPKKSDLCMACHTM